MNFKKWVKSIQTPGYNGARTVHTIFKTLELLNNFAIRVDSSTAWVLLIKQQSEKVSNQWAWQMTYYGIEKSGAGRQNEGFPSLCNHQGAYVPEIDGFFL